MGSGRKYKKQIVDWSRTFVSGVLKSPQFGRLKRTLGRLATPALPHTPIITIALTAFTLFFIGNASAVGSGIYFVKNTNTNIGSFPSSIPNNSFRIDTSTTNAASVSSISASFVGSSSATLSPTTGWTQIVSTSQDDANIAVALGFNTTFNGTTYSSAYISSNTYITFGSGSSNYSSLSASNPNIPGVFFCSQDNSYQKVFYKLDSAGVMRVRYEGNNSTSGTVGSPTIVYEAVFYTGQSYFDIHMGANSACPGAVAPTVSSVSSNKANGSYKAGEVIDIDVTFSENVTSTGNVTVTLETGATDRTCTFTISSSNFGTCNYTVQAGDTSADLNVNSVTGTIKNSANVTLTNTTPTTNLAANKALVIDTTAPAVTNVTSSLANGSYKSGQVVPIQIVFGETVVVATATPKLTILTGDPATTNVDYSSGSNSNTLVFNYTVAGTNYSTDLSYSSTTSLALNGATIKDVAGNAATLTLASPGASASLNNNKAIVIDNTAPTVALASSSNSTTNAAIPATATFSESVTSFAVGDISVTNGTAGSFSGSGTTYTFTVTPTGQGAVSFYVPASSAPDAAANNNTVSNTISRTYDSVVPTVAITTAVSSPTLQTPIPYTATFSEAVTGMALSDVTVTNGTAGNFVAVSTTVYTFDVSPVGHPTLNVDVTISINANKAQDNAGNNNSASDSGTPAAIRFDNHNPTVSLTTSANEPTNTSTISVTATFSEGVTGLLIGEIDVTNGTASGLSGSGTSYSFTVTPTTQGAVTVRIPASVSQDSATNLNLISNLLTRTYDSVAPTVALTSSASNPTSSAPIPFTATFSEAVTGFTVGDLTIGNGTAGNFAGSGTTYTFDVTPSGQGAVTATVPATTSVDAAGNDNSVSNTLSRTYDSTGPSILEVTPVPSPSNDSTPSYTFSSSEAGAIAYSGSCNSATSSADSGNNTVIFSSLADGSYTDCAIVVLDSLSNPSNALVVNSFTIETVAPTVSSIVLDDTTLTTGETSLVTITFSEEVTNFSNADITTIGSGTLSSVSTGDSGITWTATYTPNTSTQDLTNIIRVSLSGLSDLAGNAGVGTADSDNYIVDTQAPTISSISSNKANGSYKAGDVIDVDVTFSEAVTSTGNVTVTLETGATDRTCTFTVSSSTTGTCNYTVQAGDTSADLNVNSVAGTIADGYAAAMTDFVPASTLAANKALVIDTAAPEIVEVTKVTTPTFVIAPQYVFSANEAGTITYSGACSSLTTSASLGNNTITLAPLAAGTYSGCTVQVTDATGNVSNTLTINNFVIQATTSPVVDNKTVDVVITPAAGSVADDSEEPTTSTKIVLNEFPVYQTDEGKKLDLAVNQVVYFEVKGDEHSATITEITDDYVTFVIASKPKYGKLKIGETGQYDVDEDGTLDIEISVLGLSGKYVGMSFKQLIHPGTDNAENGFNNIMRILLVVGLAGLALIVLSKKRSSKEA